MRKIKNLQLELAGTAIEDIRFNLKSRDDIPHHLNSEMQH